MSNPKCMAEHRNEVIIVFSLSLAFVYNDIVPVGTMHVIKHTFIPSFWKLTIVILIKSKHACTSRPNQTDFNNLLKAAAEWTFFNRNICYSIAGQTCGTYYIPQQTLLSGIQTIFLPFLSNTIRLFSLLENEWSLQIPKHFLSYESLHQRNFEYWTKTLRILSLFFI